MQKGVKILILFLVCSNAYTQILNIKFKHITSADGLVHNQVLSITEDRTGFLWFATRDGLCRYDGYTIKLFQHHPADTNSLCNNNIRQLFIDHSGVLWIATANGLDRYNAEKETFIHYTARPDKINALNHPNTNCIVEDKDHNLWVATLGGGLNVLDSSRKFFKHYVNNPLSNTSISENNIRCLYADSKGYIWMGFVGKEGINKFDPQSEIFIRYPSKSGVSASYSNFKIRVIYEDKNNNIWLGTDGNGLCIIDDNGNILNCYKNDPNNPYSISFNVVTSLIEDNNSIWVGTENGGLCILEKSTGKFHRYKDDGVDKGSLNNNSIYAIYKSRNGDIWMGTYAGGVNVLYKSFHIFEHFRKNGSGKGLTNNEINCFWQDKEGRIWIGTDGGGINIYNVKENSFSTLRHNPNDPSSLGSDYVLYINEDRLGNLWVGTWDGGLNLYDKHTGKFKRFMHNATNPNSIGSDRVWFAYQDVYGMLWVGSVYGSLDIYDYKTGYFKHLRSDPADPKTISSVYLMNICEDKYNNLWVGTDGGGLNMYDREKLEFVRFEHNENDTSSLSDNNILVCFKDHKGDLWFGTNRGLNKLNADTRTFKVYNTQNGLPSNYIVGIQEDNRGNLWVSTNKGLSVLNPATGKCLTYSSIHGLQDNEFRRPACFTDRDGYMYFGGLKGFNRFYPDSIKISLSYTPIVITDFQIFNKAVEIGAKGSPLTRSITQTDEITLSHKHAVFSLEYSALNFAYSAHIEYAYKLENFDESWNYAGHKRFATYTNLDPGTYYFTVKCLINGEWVKSDNKLTIHVLPPFWKTWWFRILMILIVLGSLLLIYWVRLYRMRRMNIRLVELVDERTKEIQEKNKALIERTEELNATNSMLQEKQEQILEQTEQLKEANTTKDKLFSIIAHDLRNPFHAIIGLSDIMVNNDQLTISEIREQASLIYNSSTSTYELLENLLQWSISQRGKIDFKPKEVNLLQLFQTELNLLYQQAKNKNLLIEFSHKGIAREVRCDRHMIGTIIRNLVSNAIKFSYENDKIFVSLDFEDKFYLFSVADNGVGIAGNVRENMFKLNISKTQKGTGNEKGSGLGLVLCAEFVKWHKGEIWVESQCGIGSTFYVKLPYNLDELS